MLTPSLLSTMSTSTPHFSSPKSSPVWQSSTDSSERTPSSQGSHLPHSDRSDELIFAFSPSLAEEIAAHRAQRRAQGSAGALGALRPNLQTVQRANAALQAMLEAPSAPSCKAASSSQLAPAFSLSADTASNLGVTSDGSVSDSSHEAQPPLPELETFLTLFHSELHSPAARAQHPRRHAWTPTQSRATSASSESDPSPCAQAAKRRRHG